MLAAMNGGVLWAGALGALLAAAAAIGAIRWLRQRAVDHAPARNVTMCAACKEREALVHVTQIQGRAATHVDLCEKCAAERGIDTPTGTRGHGFQADR
jgi:hypothetical protein